MFSKSLERISTIHLSTITYNASFDCHLLCLWHMYDVGYVFKSSAVTNHSCCCEQSYQDVYSVSDDDLIPAHQTVAYNGLVMSGANSLIWMPPPAHSCVLILIVWLDTLSDMDGRGCHTVSPLSACHSKQTRQTHIPSLFLCARCGWACLPSSWSIAYSCAVLQHAVSSSQQT